MKNNYIVVWPICRKVSWSSVVHKRMELLHVLYFFVIYHCIMQYYHVCPCYVTAGSHLQSWLRFSEVTSDILHHLANSALECSEVLWLHLRRSVCSVLRLMFSFVYRVLSLVFFVFAIHTSSIFHTPPVEEYRPTVWMDFVPLPHSIHITIIRQLQCNMLEKSQRRKSNLMWFLDLCFIIYLPLTSSSELWSYLHHCFAVIPEQCCTEWKLSQGTLKEGLYITYICVYFSYKYEL